MKTANYLKDVVFEKADNDQVTRHFENNSQIHSVPLSVGAYFDIQHKLADTAASFGNTSYWILRAPEHKLGIISSCTTYLRDAMLCEGQGVGYTKVVIITDVFTHPEYRMQGMAKLLLRKLQDHLDGETFGGAKFSVVTRMKPLSTMQLCISLGKLQIQDRPVVKGAKFLEYKEVLSLAKDDCNTTQLRISGHRNGIAHVQISPTEALARWHLMRSRLFSQYLSHGKMSIETHGASSDISFPAWAWWVHDYRSKRLVIGRVYVARLSGFKLSIRPLLESAVVEAALCGLREVVILDPDDQVVTAAEMVPLSFPDQEVQVSHVEGLNMMPCLRWRGGEHPKKLDVVMKDRQYYGWS